MWQTEIFTHFFLVGKYIHLHSGNTFSEASWLLVFLLFVFGDFVYRFDPMGFKSQWNHMLDVTPLPVTVTTRIITCLVREFYTPLFATVTGRGPHPPNTSGT